MKTSKTFIAYGQRNHLNCLGYFKASLRAGTNMISSRIYVIQGEAAALLDCDACVINHPLNVNTPLKPASFPSSPWEKGAIDIVGPIGKTQVFDNIHKLLFIFS